MLAGGAAALVALLLLISGSFYLALADRGLAKSGDGRSFGRASWSSHKWKRKFVSRAKNKCTDDVYLRARESARDRRQTITSESCRPSQPTLRRAAERHAYERANAAYVAKDYGEAERWAMQAANEARKVTPANPKAVIEALELAGLSAQAGIQYSRAMQHFREAEKFADVNRNSEEWANLQDAIADLLFAQGNYGDAEKLYRSVIAIRSRVLGPEHPDTLASRHRLIYALNEEEKHAEAEAEARQVVTLREKILGFEHPDTLLSRYNLASALYHEGKYAEAERLYRESSSWITLSSAQSIREPWQRALAWPIHLTIKVSLRRRFQLIAM